MSAVGFHKEKIIPPNTTSALTHSRSVVQPYTAVLTRNIISKVTLSHACHVAVSRRYHYMRGLVNTVSSKRLDALEDFQSLYKTDADIFPLQMVKWLVDSLPEAERLQVSPP